MRSSSRSPRPSAAPSRRSFSPSAGWRACTCSGRTSRWPRCRSRRSPSVSRSGRSRRRCSCGRSGGVWVSSPARSSPCLRQLRAALPCSADRSWALSLRLPEPAFPPLSLSNTALPRRTAAARPSRRRRSRGCCRAALPRRSSARRPRSSPATFSRRFPLPELSSRPPGSRCSASWSSPSSGDRRACRPTRRSVPADARSPRSSGSRASSSP